MTTTVPHPPTPLRRVRTPLRIRARELIRGPVQALLWTGTGLLAFWLTGVSGAPGRIPGTVLPVEARLGFSRDGRIAELCVEPGTLVARGTLLGRLDDAELLARISLAERAVAEVAAELASAASRHELRKAERVLEYRLSDARLSVDEEGNEIRRLDSWLRLEMEAHDRRLAAIALEGELESERLAADLVTLRLSRARRLAELNVGQRADVEDLALEEAEARREIAALEEQLQETRKGADAFEERLEADGGLAEAQQPVRERSLLETADHEAAVAEMRVIECRLERRRSEVEALRAGAEGLELRSTIDGRVTSVEALPGQAVLSGAAVVHVRSEAAEVVVLYLAEPVSPDDDLPVTLPVGRASVPEVTSEARVLGFGGGVELLPERLWAHPDRPVYGRTLLLSPPEALRLVPGEEVLAELP